MRKSTLQIFAAAAVLSFVGAVAASAHKSPGKSSDEKILEEVAGYRDWGRVSQEPARVPLDAASAGG